MIDAIDARPADAKPRWTSWRALFAIAGVTLFFGWISLLMKEARPGATATDYLSFMSHALAVIAGSTLYIAWRAARRP